MAVILMEISIKIIYKAMGIIFEVMEDNTKANDIIIKCMDKGSFNGLMEGNILADMIMIKSMDLGNLYGRMEGSIEGIGNMENSMEGHINIYIYNNIFIYLISFFKKRNLCSLRLN